MPADRASSSVRPLRIAILEPVGEGGFAHFIDEYSAASARAGAEVRLFTSSRYEFRDQPRPYSVDCAIRLWPAHEPPRPDRSRLGTWFDRTRRRARRPRRAAQLAWEVWRAGGRALDWSPDIVQLTRAEHNAVAPFVRRRCLRRGVMVTELVHELGDRENRRGIATGVALSFFSDRFGQPDGFVVLSEEISLALARRKGIDPRLIATVPFGSSRIAEPDAQMVTSYRERFDTTNKPLLLNFGTIRPSKGIPVLLEAVSKVPSNLLFTMLIAGHPTAAVQPDALRRRAAQPDLCDRVSLDFRYLDRVEVASLLEVASLVVLPYLSASQSAVVHQAKAHGVPILATRVGAIAHDVNDGIDGRLVPPGDVDALAEVLTELLRQPEILAKLANAARTGGGDAEGWDATGVSVVDAYQRWRDQRISAR